MALRAAVNARSTPHRGTPTDFEFALELARLRVVQIDRAVHRRDGNVLRVGRDGDARHDVGGVVDQSVRQRARLPVPDFGRLVGAARDEEATVGRPLRDAVRVIRSLARKKHKQAHLNGKDVLRNRKNKRRSVVSEAQRRKQRVD